MILLLIVVKTTTCYKTSIIVYLIINNSVCLVRRQYQKRGPPLRATRKPDGFSFSSKFASYWMRNYAFSSMPQTGGNGAELQLAFVIHPCDGFLAE